MELLSKSASAETCFGFDGVGFGDVGVFGHRRLSIRLMFRILFQLNRNKVRFISVKSGGKGA